MFLYYHKGTNCLPEIVPEQAEIVKRIYQLFVQGKTPSGIAKLLTAEYIPTLGGKVKWQNPTVESILQKEKYKGDAILQKSFTVDVLQKKMKVNAGEVPQYYVENIHLEIIPSEGWNLVQADIGNQTELDAQKQAIVEDMETTAELIHRCVDGNAFKVQNQTEYFKAMSATLHDMKRWKDSFSI